MGVRGRGAVRIVFLISPIVLPLMLMMFVYSMKRTLSLSPGAIESTTAPPPFRPTQWSPTRHHQGQCSAVTNLYLLKLHKSGSTTLYGIVSRLALRNRMRFAVYERRPYDTHKRDALVRNLIPPFTERSPKYNVVADHSRYDIGPLKRILAQPAGHIAFIRNPVSHTRSWLYHFSMVKALNITAGDPVVQVLARKDTYNIKAQRLVDSARDTVADAFRIPKNVLPTSHMFKASLYNIRNTFVVGITEYFSESLVLMRRKLCWSLKDILFVPLRISRYKKPNEKHDEGLYETVCKWARLDCALYTHFNDSLWTEIKSHGSDFTNEVLYFNLVQKRVESFCAPVYEMMKKNMSHIFQLNENVRPVWFPKTEWSAMFKIGVVDCALMRIDEFQYSNIFYYIQNREACTVVKNGTNTNCRIQPKQVGPNFCKLLCHSTYNPWTMVMNVLTDKRTYLWS